MFYRIILLLALFFLQIGNTRAQCSAGKITGPYKICGEGYTKLLTTGTIGKIQWQRLRGNVFVDEPGAIHKLHHPYISSTTSFRVVACETIISDTIIVVKEDKPLPPTASHDSLNLLSGESGIVSLVVSSPYRHAQYTWYSRNNSREALAHGNRLLYEVNCSYNFNLTDSFYVSSILPGSDCASDRTISTAIVDCEEEITSITISPNPNKGVFTIVGRDVKEPVGIDIYTINGKLVHSVDRELLHNFNEEIVLTEIAKGMYIVKIQGISIQEIRKIVIQ